LIDQVRAFHLQALPRGWERFVHASQLLPLGKLKRHSLQFEEHEVNAAGVKGLAELGNVGRRQLSPTPSSTRPAAACATFRSGSRACCSA
jgi:hypothetical protein